MKIKLNRFFKKKRKPTCIENDTCLVALLPRNDIKVLFIGISVLFFLLNFKPDAYAQSVTLKKSQASLESVIKELESQCDYVFLYKKTEIQPIKNLNIDFKSMPLNDVLTAILKDLQFEYQVFDKTIFIKKIPKVKTNLPEGLSKQLTGIVKGKVVDENELPLKGVLIKEQKVGSQAFSNENGDFTIKGGSSGALDFTGEGFSRQVINYKDSTELYVKMEKGKMTLFELNEVAVNTNNLKERPTQFIDMKNRNYMNLSQVLQGTIPGLSLQVSTKTTKEVVSVDAYVYREGNVSIGQLVHFSLDEFFTRFGKTEGQRIIDILLEDKNVPDNIRYFYRINTTSRVTTTLVPQIRGANTFGNNGANMLVVIDGFPQDGFPANYPMTNVESIEVIKDQRELVKWGPKASGGVILVKTKAALKGKIQVTYTSNFYYEPAQKYSREKLQLASTADYLDYIKEVDKNFGVYYTDNMGFNFTPARRLFAQNKAGQLTPESYNRKLDSLSALDNESQLNLLMKDKFSQSHTINLNGGNNLYKFNLISNYENNQTNSIGAYDKTISFSLNNDIRLLKNKLKIKWLINYKNGASRSGYSFSPDLLIEPYQMLLDEKGNYVYDYSDFSAKANTIMMANGYKNHGLNLLEDARVNSNLAHLTEKKTRFDFSWTLLPDLQWIGSGNYTGGYQKTNHRYGKESTYVRRLVNIYGEYNATGVNFYVPYGDVLQINERDSYDWNARSGLSYSKSIENHRISLSVGAGAAGLGSNRPSSHAIYGYDSASGTITPAYMPTPNPLSTIKNFYALLGEGTSAASPYVLTRALNGDTAISRNFNANAALNYKYGDRLSVNGDYNNMYNPLYGQSAKYSVSSSYKAEVSGLLLKHVGKILQNVVISTGINGIKMPDLPAIYSNIRYQQLNWDNYTIWVNGLQPTQQKGQSSKTLFQKLTFGLADSTFIFNVVYNTQKIKGQLSTLNADPSSTSQNDSETTQSNYLSSGVKINLRKGLLMAQLDYSKSPEGQSQVNGFGGYDIAREDYFKSNFINALSVGFKILNVSSYQGLGIMMGTNSVNNGSYSQATNSDFSLLPPRNSSYEINAKMGLKDDAYVLDLRYYNQTSSGLDNSVPVLTDPATGLSTKVTYSSITNRGLEFFLKSRIAKAGDFEYNLTINGAINHNIASQVPEVSFYGSDNYARAYRQGYDVSNLWSVKWGGLNHEGDPQIYDGNGNLTSILDSATVVSSMVYSGVTVAPWTGGLIHEVQFKSLFARAAFVFNLGHVMRTYIPYASNNNETNVLIKDRWRNPGDENFTDIAKMSSELNGYRSFVARNATNSVVSADNIRFQELMIGWNLSTKLLGKLGLSSGTIALQAQNIGIWTRNKFHVDPATVSGAGRVSLPLQPQYSCNISIGF